MIFPESFFSLRIFGSLPEFDHQLETDQRAKSARIRRDIDLQEQDLLQQAAIQERQISA